MKNDFCKYLRDYFVSLGYVNTTLIMSQSKIDYTLLVNYFNSSKCEWPLYNANDKKFDIWLNGFMEIFIFKAHEFKLPKENIKIKVVPREGNKEVMIELNLSKNLWSKQIINKT